MPDKRKVNEKKFDKWTELESNEKKFDKWTELES